MGSFRNNARGGFRGRNEGSSGGGFGGGRGGFGRGRDSDRGERRPIEMHDATCNKCRKECRVPFKPTGSKPVFCSDCFRQNEGSADSFRPRNNERSERFGESQSISPNISSNQLNQINVKLDKILAVLQDLEIDVEEDLEEHLESDSDKESEDDSEEN